MSKIKDDTCPHQTVASKWVWWQTTPGEPGRWTDVPQITIEIFVAPITTTTTTTTTTSTTTSTTTTTTTTSIATTPCK